MHDLKLNLRRAHGAYSELHAKGAARVYQDIEAHVRAGFVSSACRLARGARQRGPSRGALLAALLRRSSPGGWTPWRAGGARSFSARWPLKLHEGLSYRYGVWLGNCSSLRGQV